MGGSIFVGVRLSDGTEHLMDIWTNPLPWHFMNPGFWLEEKKAIKDFLLQAKRSPKWCEGRLKEIKPGEYCAVLIDFKTKKLISRNCYTTPGFKSFSQPDQEDLDALKRLRDLGWVTKVEVFGKNSIRKLRPAELEKLWGLLDQDKWPDRLHFIHYRPPGWELDTAYKGGTYSWRGDGKSWPEIVRWVENNGWTSPIRSVEQVLADREEE